MPNKVIIPILVCFLIIFGLLGGYCFYLNQEIVALTELQADTNRQIGNIQDSIAALDTKMTSLNQMTKSQITGLEDKINALNTSIEGISPAIDAEGLYQKIKGSVVEVLTETKGGEEKSGSGFVFHSERFIVTAYHVVKDADKVDVILNDGTITTANRIHYCPYSDIAVLRLEQKADAEALTLGDSNALTIGQPVIVIGSPFALSGTITAGIVSQKDRFVEIDYDGDQYQAVANLIQCDASVNFGNSGGPLINAEGEVIGLVIARVDPLEGDGIYYAVSSNKLQRVTDSLIDHGFYDYPWLGIQIADLTSTEARSRQLDTVNGVLVTASLAGPAALAGIQADDIIVAIDGVPIYKIADLTSYLGEYTSAQDLVVLTIIRDGTKLGLPVRLAQRTD